MKELWKPVIGYEGLYEISNIGRLKSLPRNGTIKSPKILAKSYDTKGYIKYVLSKDNKRATWPAHRLVAQAFIPNPENKPYINHKDAVRNNNNVDNLEWCTNSENQLHRFRVMKRKPSRCHKVKCVETGKIFNSMNEAARKMGLDHAGISMAVSGIRATHGGYHWISG